MADKTFYIPQKNSSRWLKQGVTFDPRYNTRPFAERTDNNNYYEKRQSDDIDILQLISDWVPTLEYWLCNGTAPAYTIEFTEVITQVQDQTFKVYQAEVDFSTFTPNRNYIGYIRYTDDDEQVQTWACTPIDLRTKWANSLLLQYTSTQFTGGSDNDGTFWIDDLILNHRFDGVLRNYKPGSNRTDYNDQDYNGSLLFGQDFITQTLLVYNSLGLGIPDWEILKINAIFTECNNTKLDGVNYILADGQDFKLTRPEGSRVVNGRILNEDAYFEVDVQLVPNPKFGRLTTGIVPDDNEYTIMPLPLHYVNQGASWSIPNKFKADMDLRVIRIINNGGGAFDMQMGTALGGTDIEARIPVLAVADPQVFQLNHGFKVASTLFITVPDGVDIDVWIEYQNYNQPPINLNPATPAKFVENVVYSYYNEVTFNDHFDNTGIGRIGTDFEGCVLADSNGVLITPDGKSGTNLTLLHDPTKLGQFASIDGTLTIAKTNLPAEGVLMFGAGDDPTAKPGNALNNSNTPNAGRSVGGSAEYFMSGGVQNATVGLSGKLGDGTPLPNVPKGVWVAYFVYIGS